MAWAADRRTGHRGVRRYGQQHAGQCGARASVALTLPNLEALGLGTARTIEGVAPVPAPAAALGVAGASQSGQGQHHRSLGALRADPPRAFPTYPARVSRALLAEFSRRTGRGVLGNKAASGTMILDELGEEHRRTGRGSSTPPPTASSRLRRTRRRCPWQELYAACAVARELLTGPTPSRGSSRDRSWELPGHWMRTPDRKDLSLSRPARTLLDGLEPAGIPAVGVGKVDDLFAGRGISSPTPPPMREAYRLIDEALATMERGFLFANVIEFDQSLGPPERRPGVPPGPARTGCRPAGTSRLRQTGRPDYLHRGPRQRSDHALHRSFARGGAAAGLGPEGAAGRAGRATHLRRYGADGGGVPRRGASCPPAIHFFTEVWRD